MPRILRLSLRNRLMTGLSIMACCLGLGGCGANVDTPASTASMFASTGKIMSRVSPAGTASNLAGTAGITLREDLSDATGLRLVAGDIGGPGSIDGAGTAARFHDPLAVTVDAYGTLYVADTANHVIRKITPSGIVSTVAGIAGSYGSRDGDHAEARFNAPSGIAVDQQGNLYVADSGNHTIRKITPAGMVSTVAGAAGIAGSSDGAGMVARFDSPFGITADASGTLYVADTNNLTVRKITPAGVVSTLAGAAGMAGPEDGLGADARFNGPHGITLDSAGNIYLTDTVHFPQSHGGANNSTIRKITPAGVVTTIAGTQGVLGSVDGTGRAASFYYPEGLAADAAGNLYVADTYNGVIRKITPAGAVSTVAGAVGGGSVDGAGAVAHFLYPSGIASDREGKLLVADSGNSTIRKITPSGMVETLAGRASLYGSTDGSGAAARFNGPAGIAADAAGNLYIADTYNGTVRKISRGGAVTTLAGRAGIFGGADGEGTMAEFGAPDGMATDEAGNLYVADRGNHTIRKITAAGIVTTLAGSAGIEGNADGSGATARFRAPSGIAVDGAHNVYVADSGNHTIRKITPAGWVRTIAGVAGSSGDVDGNGPTARFNSPTGVAVDAAGNLYVADTDNHAIRKISSTGNTVTLAGAPGIPGAVDGTGASARFFYPRGVTTDAHGMLYVADTLNHTIRAIMPSGAVITVAGVANRQGILLGGLPGGLSLPFGIASTGTDALAITSANSVLKLKMR